jgi:hypothetical protein
VAEEVLSVETMVAGATGDEAARGEAGEEDGDAVDERSIPTQCLRLTLSKKKKKKKRQATFKVALLILQLPPLPQPVVASSLAWEYINGHD